VDEYTVDFILQGPTPLLLNGLTNIAWMDREWMTANNCLDSVDPAKGRRGTAQHPC